jgi:hypothetical protein
MYIGDTVWPMYIGDTVWPMYIGDTGWPMYIGDTPSPNSAYNGKYFRQKLYRKSKQTNKQTLYSITFLQRLFHL